MTNEADASDAGWFANTTTEDIEAATEAITTRRVEEPQHWPQLAVEAGYVDSVEAYYECLHSATMQTARQEIRAKEGADDQQLIHTIRALDDTEQTANELAERVHEWAGSLGFDTDGGIAGSRTIAKRDPSTDSDSRLVALAAQVVALDDERAALREEVERSAPTVAPNLTALGEPVLAARLIALAGSLEALARMPSGTVQVLGAEEALFAHLRGEAPSPKHGVIYTHDAVRGTRPAQRGSAARALAGKLTIAARVDHYAGDRRPELEDDLADRIATIQEREGES